MMRFSLPILVLLQVVLLPVTIGFSTQHPTSNAKTTQVTLAMASGNEENYQNKVAEFFSNFLPGSNSDQEDPLGNFDFGAPKLNQKLSLEGLAQALDEELYQKEWFVTGKVNPIYFAESFQFQDPDVAVTGIEGRYKLVGFSAGRTSS